MPITFRTARAAPWRELRLGQDLLQAMRAASPRGLRAARGEHVLIIPGFGTNDAVMGLLHRNLRARGFSTHRWNQGVNLGPAPGVLRQLGARVRHLARDTGRPVHIVGWSMGGVLARAVASRMRHLVGRVVALGSPLSGDPDCSWLSAIVARCSGDSLTHRRVRRMLSESASVPVSAIFSRHDGVVHWQASANARGDIVPIEVETSHVGMIVNPEVFDAVAQALIRDVRA
jgi:hypothetical protein